MHLLTENLGWKAFALMISGGLWYGFVGETELATSVPVAVQFKNVPADLEVSSEPLDRVFLRLRGPATRINPGTLTQVIVRFDLDQVDTPGEHTFSLGSGNIQLPAGVHVGQVIPSQVRLTFDKRVTREVPVEVRYAGPPPRGYRVSQHHTLPENVRITGPERRVDGVHSVQTDPIDLATTVGNSEF